MAKVGIGSAADRRHRAPSDRSRFKAAKRENRHPQPNGRLPLNAADHRRLSRKVTTVCCWPRPPSGSNCTRLNGGVTPQALPQAITLEYVEASAKDTLLQLAA